MAKMSLDHSVGRSLHMKKMSEEAHELIVMVANNQYMYTSQRNLVNIENTQKKEIPIIIPMQTLLIRDGGITLTLGGEITRGLNKASRMIRVEPIKTGSTTNSSNPLSSRWRCFSKGSLT
ncbi:hypothetical protein AHAS_Ahas13G0277800 [Arachis hypogaea]